MRAARRAANVSPSDPPAVESGAGVDSQRRVARERALPVSPHRGGVTTRVPPGIVPTLLRSRPVASGPRFVVHVNDVAEGMSGVRGRLIVAAPKRVLKRAVERNAIRRVAREAWRAAGLDRSAVVALLRVRAPFVVSAPGAGLPARKRLAREELDRLFVATGVALRKRAKAR